MYRIENRFVQTIYFYEDGAVRHSVRQGWLERDACTGRYPRDIARLGLAHGLTRRSRRNGALNLTKGGHFYTARSSTGRFSDAEWDLYIDLALNDVTLGAASEVESYRNDRETVYHQVRELSGDFDGAHETTRITAGETRVERTAFGDRLAEIATWLDAHGHRVATTAIEDMVRDPALIAQLVAASRLVCAAPAAATCPRVARSRSDVSRPRC